MKIHFRELGILVLEYKRLPEPKHERLGQYLCNRTNTTCQQLFYASDDEVYSDAVSKNPKFLKIRVD